MSEKQSNEALDSVLELVRDNEVEATWEQEPSDRIREFRSFLGRRAAELAKYQDEVDDEVYSIAA